jgi:hypothetical protein
MTPFEIAQPSVGRAQHGSRRRALRAPGDQARATFDGSDVVDARRRSLARQIGVWHAQCRTGAGALQLAATLDAMVVDLLGSSENSTRRSPLRPAARESHAGDLQALAQRLRNGQLPDAHDLLHSVDTVLVELALTRSRPAGDHSSRTSLA